jgi:hypothetical protein
VRVWEHTRTDRATYAAFGGVGWRGWKVVSIRVALWARSVRYGVKRHSVLSAKETARDETYSNDYDCIDTVDRLFICANCNTATDCDSVANEHADATVLASDFFDSDRAGSG